MKCPYCEHPETKVIDSRDAEQGIHRRRECQRCGLRFNTDERVQHTSLWVSKRDGRREEFNREKLATSIRIACAKRPLPSGAIEKMVDEIEAELARLGRAEIPSRHIGELVMSRLKQLDRVAYIRFASVYREFHDIETFKQEVDSLLQGQPTAAALTGQLPLLPAEQTQTPPKKHGRRPRNTPILNPNLPTTGAK